MLISYLPGGDSASKITMSKYVVLPKAYSGIIKKEKAIEKINRFHLIEKYFKSITASEVINFDVQRYGAGS